MSTKSRGTHSRAVSQRVEPYSAQNSPVSSPPPRGGKSKTLSTRSGGSGLGGSRGGRDGILRDPSNGDNLSRGIDKPVRLAVSNSDRTASNTPSAVGIGGNGNKTPRTPRGGGKKNTRHNQTNHNDKSNKPNKKKNRSKPRKRTFYEKLLLSLGYSIGNVTLKDPRAIEAAQALNLQPWHLKRLKAKFDKVDIDGSGNIDIEEFFEAVGEQRSPFTDKLFALIDLDGSGTIEFDEYVRVLATYCMFNKDEILRFCFECFDVDKSGTIDEKEFVELCKTVNNASPSFPNNFKRALEEFDVNEDGLIDYAEFLEIDRRYPLVLFPAFRLQDTMQRNSLGERAWVHVIEEYQEAKRIEEYKAAHGGRAPPDPAFRAIMKAFFPCMYHERVHIQVGAEMEARHRGSHD